MTDTAARPQSITDEFAREWGPRFCAGWNSHDPEQIVKLTTDDVHWEDPFIYPNGALHGQAALGEWIASILRAFGDVEFQVVGQPLIALDRSRLMFEWVGTSRMTGALDPPGFAPTGGMVEFRGIDTHDFRDDLLAHVWTVTDVAAVAGQIGAMPPPGSIGEKLGVQVQHLMAKRLRRKG